MAVDPRATDAEQRAAARATWRIARFCLGDEPPDDLIRLTTPAERIAMMRELAESAWAFAGRALPVYDRRDIPARIFRPGTPRPSDDDT
jgi:hypothetical protein